MLSLISVVGKRRVSAQVATMSAVCGLLSSETENWGDNNLKGGPIKKEPFPVQLITLI